MILETDGYKFDFPNAIELFKFDSDDKESKYYHGLSHNMKAVDVVAVFKKFQLWIEIKNFPSDKIDSFKINPDKKGTKGNKNLADYIGDLKLKFRDTFIYRYCEGKDTTHIAYVFLTNLPDSLCNHCIKVLKKDIPVGNPIPNRWNKTLLEKDQFYVLTPESWERNFKESIGCCTKQSNK